MDQNRLSFVTRGGRIVDIDTSNHSELQPLINSKSLRIVEHEDGTCKLLVLESVRSLHTWGNGNVAFSSPQGDVIRRKINGIEFPYGDAWESIPADLPAWMDSTSRMFWGTAFNLDITMWNTSRIKDMTYMFNGCYEFNQPIGSWDVRNVVTMGGMFGETDAFNQPLSGWNTRNVKDMSHMFLRANAFNQPLNDWDVSGVENMERMFWDAELFDQPLDRWDTSSVKTMREMFMHSKVFNQNINAWDVSNVRDFYGMFESTQVFNQPLDRWVPSAAKNMTRMFYRAKAFNRDISPWNVSSVTEMVAMFSEAEVFDQPLNGWDVSSVIHMRSMFKDAPLFNQDLDQWDTSSLETLDGMFEGASSFNGKVESLNLLKVDRLSDVFRNATSFNQPLNGWNVSNLTSIGGLFRGATSFNQPLDKWDVSKITSMFGMFHDATAFNQDLSMWCVELMRYDGTNFDEGATAWTKPRPIWGTCGGLVRSPVVLVDTEDELSGTMPYQAKVEVRNAAGEVLGERGLRGEWIFKPHPVAVGEIAYLFAVVEGAPDSEPVEIVGKGVAAPIILVNESSELSGTGAPDALVRVRVDYNYTLSSRVGSDGKWSFNPNPVLTTESANVWIELESGKSSEQVYIAGENDGTTLWKPEPPVLLVNESDEVSGTAMPLTQVNMDLEYSFRSTKSDFNGNWSFDENPIPVGEKGTLLTWVDYNLKSNPVEFDGRIPLPKAPVVLVNTREELSGIVDESDDIRWVALLDEEGDDIDSVEVDDGINWEFKPNPLQSEQTAYLISESWGGVESEPTPVTAGYIDLYPPIVTVSTVAELSGTAPAGSVVTAVLSGDTLGSATVGDDNQWSFTPHPFPIGTVGQVYAIDPNTGDESERVDVPGMYKDGESVEPPPPIEPPIDGEVMPPTLSGYTCEWKPRVTLGGVDVSDRLTGRIIVDREESAAGIATFGLFYEPGEAVDPDVAQRAVTVGFLTDTESRLLFSGFVAEPVWDAVSRVLSITATDNLQERVEAMSVEQIDALVGGDWSEQVFGSMDGKSHWDYAQERLSTTLLALDCTTTGDVRVTELNAQNPIYRFKPGTIIYDSLQLDLPRSKTVTNRFEIKTSYRFPRLRQGDYRYYWLHSYTLGSEGMQGFCRWRVNSTELPSQSMVIEATESAGLVPTQVRWISLPMSNPDPCGTQVPWINRFPDLLLGAEWVGSRRWTQYMTEEYELIVTTRFAQENEAQRVINRSSASFDHDTDLAREWSGTLVSLADEQDYEPQDNDDNAERDRMLEVKLKQAQCEIIKAHRASRVTFSVVSCFAGDLDLSNRIEVNDYGVRARGKCFARTDTLDIETGSCVTTLTIALLRGASGAITQPTVPPRLHGEYAPEPVEQLPDLATQIAGDVEYDEELDGFAGNRSISTAPEPFPRRMQLTSPELPEDEQNENVLTGTAVHYVDFKEDELSIQ